MAASFTVEDISVSRSVFDANDSLVISYTVKNTGTVNMTNYSASLRCKDGDTYPLVADIETGPSIKAGKLYTVTHTLNLEQLVSTTTVNSLFDGTIRSMPAFLQVTANFNGDLRLLRSEIGVMLNRRFDPRINRVSVLRCSAQGHPLDEGIYVRLFCDSGFSSRNILHRVLPGPVIVYSECAKVYYAQGRPATLSDPYITLSNFSSYYNEIISDSITFNAGYDYGLLLFVGDEYDYDTKTIDVYKVFSNIHLSGCGKGVALGKFSTSTLEDPLFECDYKAKFLQPVIVLAEGLLKVIEATDTVTVSSGSPTATKTITVTPGTGWTPVGVVGYKASQTWCSVREVMLVNGEVEMSLRYHGSSSTSQTVTLTAKVLCIHTG